MGLTALRVSVKALNRLHASGVQNPGRWADAIGDDIRDLAGRDRSAIDTSDDDVVSSFVGQRSGFVGRDALVEMAETAAELPDRACGEVTQIALGELCVFAADPDFAAEGEVVANEHTSTGDESSRVGLVVAVAQPDDPPDIGCFSLRDC